MASGPGRARGGIRIQEPHTAESSTAAAAESPPPAPPSDCLQERAHGPPGAGGQNPSDAAAAAKRKGKMVMVAPSPLPSSTSSEGSDSLLSSDIVSVSGDAESISADTLGDGGGRSKVSWKSPLVEGVMEVRTVPRNIDLKAVFDNLLLEQQWSQAEEMEMQQSNKGKPPIIWPDKVFKKSLWRKFKAGMTNMFSGRIERLMHGLSTYSTEMAPHVAHQTFPITVIIDQYELIEMDAGRRAIFRSNALNLRRAYSEFRPVHGDGECFYRSFIFSYLEQVLDRHDTHEEHRLLAAVKGVARQHARLDWTSEFSWRHKAFKMLIKKVIRWKRHSRWKNVPTTNSYRKQKLLKFFNGDGRMSAIFAFLRLVAAIWICSHSEQFEPLVPEVNEHYTLRDWCSHEVIQSKVFTDHVQMTALVTALRVPLRVECLLRGVTQDLYTGQEDSQDDMPRSTCWPRRHHQLSHGHVVPRVTVLYTNIHYDIIYPHLHDAHVLSVDESCSPKTSQVQRPTAENSSQQITKPDNCSGESSSQHIAQVESSGVNSN